MARVTDRSAVTAVRDHGHPGDIKGAFGTLRADAGDQPATLGRRLRCLLAMLRDGLIAIGEQRPSEKLKLEH